MLPDVNRCNLLENVESQPLFRAFWLPFFLRIISEAKYRFSKTV